MMKGKKFFSQLVGCSFFLNGINICKATDNDTVLNSNAIQTESNQNILTLQDTTRFLEEMTIFLFKKINEYFDDPDEYYQKYFKGINLTQEYENLIDNSFRKLYELEVLILNERRSITWKDVNTYLFSLIHAKSFIDHPVFGPTIYKTLWSLLIETKANFWDGIYIDKEKNTGYRLKICLKLNLSINPHSFLFADQNCKGSCLISSFDGPIEKASFELKEDGIIKIKGEEISIEIGMPPIKDFYYSIKDFINTKKPLTIYNYKYEKHILRLCTDKWIELKPSNQFVPLSISVKLFPENTILNVDAECIEKENSMMLQNKISILFEKENTQNTKLFVTTQLVNTKNGKRTLEDEFKGKANLNLVYPDHIYINLSYLEKDDLYYLGTTNQIQELLSQHTSIPFYEAENYKTHEKPLESLITFDLAKVISPNQI